MFVHPPVGDEAYYWLWGQKLDWSYFDHPPFHAWLLGLVSVIGWSLLSLRLLAWATLLGTLWIFWLWAKRMSPGSPSNWWWPAVALYLASPLYFAMTSIVFHDHLLIFLVVATAHVLLVFAERFEAGHRDFRWLYAAAVLLGLAVLTKHNGALLGLGMALFFVAHSAVRRVLRTPHPYRAALLSIAIQAPVLWWNLNESFASYTFHISERWGGTIPLELHPNGLSRYAVSALLWVSPFVFPAIAGMFLRPSGAPFADRARVLALCVFGISTPTTGLLSLFVDVYFYWNIVAYPLLFPLLAGWMRRTWVVALHLMYGLTLAVLLAVSSVVPISTLNGRSDWTLSSSFGWPEVAARVEALKGLHEVGFVATTGYQIAAELGYAMRDPDVVTISPRHDQYDYWFRPEDHLGQDALIVGDTRFGVEYVSRYFEELVPLEQVPYERFGYLIYEPAIYLGKRFRIPADE
ncbi:MAG: glycosyltransferase family 39 protein [Devosia sp.]|nr:glycosyltransferase family 39 protein [Devosia sp.]